MVAYFTEQLVKVILFMTLAVVICFCSEMVKEGTDMYKVKQTKMRFAFFNNDRTNVCSCLIFKLGCQHCPENLFCNTQNSACCPISNSDNDCHNYCVPPGHTCCKRNGACKDDVPTCCGNYCCGKNEKCCGEKCCSAGTKCCNNIAHENFCIWKNTPSQVNTSPGYYSQKDNCVTQFQDTDIKYFSEICQIFAKGTRLQHIDKGFNQFAVLTLNQLSQNRNSENPYRPLPIIFDIKLQTQNYVSATPETIHEHAEWIILDDLTGRIARLKPKLKNPPTIYLFSFLSPCGSCLDEIIEIKNKIIGAKIFVGWHLTYKNMKQEEFLNGLRKMMNNEITFVYSDKLCADEMYGPPLVQPRLLKDLLRDNKDYKNVNFCESEIALRSSFVKLINWLVWECRWEFQVDGTDITKHNVINCMTKEIGNIEPKINPCIDLSETIRYSINHLVGEKKEKKGKNKKLLLSPPLDPQSVTTSFSNMLTDLTGDYGNAYLCFQVNYKRV